MDSMSTKQKRTITIDGQEIPTYQTVWELNMKTNRRIDWISKAVCVLAVAGIIVSVYCLLKQ